MNSITQSVSFFYKNYITLSQLFSIKKLHCELVSCLRKGILSYSQSVVSKWNCIAQSVSCFKKGRLSHTQSLVFNNKFQYRVRQLFSKRNSITQSLSCFPYWIPFLESLSHFCKEKKVHHTISQLFSIRNFITQSVICL